MELRHLHYFVAIAEERSFTRAAERLWVAQPGLSTQIRRLETELGVQLFDRHTRGVDLTEAGECLLERARAALAAADAAAAVGRDLASGVVGSLRIGIATGAHWGRTPALLELFTEELDSVELTVLEGYGGTLWRDLRDGRLDAIIAASSFSSPDLHRLELGAEPWVALVGADHRLGVDGPLQLCDLHGERVLVSGHRDGSALDREIAEFLASNGVSAGLVRTAPGPGSETLITRGRAVALTTCPGPVHPGVVVRPLRPAGRLAFMLMWRDEQPSLALSEFVRSAAQVAGPRPQAASLSVLAAVA